MLVVLHPGTATNKMADFAESADNQGNLKLKCTTKLVHVIERRASDRKVADSRFDSPTGNASLCH